MRFLCGVFLMMMVYTSFGQVDSPISDYFENIQLKNQLKSKIDGSTNWDQVLAFVEQHESLDTLFADPIRETMQYLASGPANHPVDSFFFDICTIHFGSFPYRSSGFLTKEIYQAEDNNLGAQAFYPPVISKSLYQWTQRLNKLPRVSLLERLLHYVDIDILTKLSRSSLDYDEAPIFLKMSDMAVELIEIFSLCDFYNNASNNHLFSELEDNARNEVKANIKEYLSFLRENTLLSSANYYLDSLCALNYSYIYTCKNLMFEGHNLVAKKHLISYYEARNLPCVMDKNSGDLLLSLGDDRLIEDCVNKITNYRCMTQLSDACIPRLLASDYPYLDDLFAELVQTEIHSLYRKNGSGPDYSWHTLFSLLASEEQHTLKKTILAFMQIEDVLKEARIYRKEHWQRKYPDEYEADFRVCDFALLKYHHSIKALPIDDWFSLKERDKALEMIRLEN